MNASSIRTHILLALRASNGEPLPVSVVVSAVISATRAERGDVEGQFNRMAEDGFLTTTRNPVTELPEAMLTTKGTAHANQIR